MRILETRHLLWPDEAACEAFARELSRCPGLMDASIELHGALGVTGRIKSPSYAVLESYELPQGEVSHFDFYRFADPREWEDAGFRDIFTAPGLKLSEWPEKAVGMLPVADLQIWLEVQADEARAVKLVAGTERGQVLLQGLEGQE